MNAETTLFFKHREDEQEHEHIGIGTIHAGNFRYTLYLHVSGNSFTVTQNFCQGFCAHDISQRSCRQKFCRATGIFDTNDRQCRIEDPRIDNRINGDSDRIPR